MRKKLPEPRYIDAASVDVGDVIRAVWKVGDVEHSRTATVGKVDDLIGTPVKLLVSEAGNEIVRIDPNNRARVRITLLERKERVEVATLF